MNARQKAKRFKRLYEDILNSSKVRAPKFPTETQNIKRYKAMQTVEASYINQISADAESPHLYIKRAIVTNLAEMIASEVRFDLLPSQIPDHVDIVGNIDVVVQKGESK